MLESNAHIALDRLEFAYRSVLTGMRICQLYAFMLLLFILMIPLESVTALIGHVFQGLVALRQGAPWPALPNLLSFPDRTWIELLAVANIWVVFHIYSRFIPFWPAVLMCLVGLAHNVYVSHRPFFEGTPIPPMVVAGLDLSAEQSRVQLLMLAIWLVGHLYFFYVAIRGQYSIHRLLGSERAILSDSRDNRTDLMTSLATFANIPIAIRYARSKLLAGLLMVVSGVSNFVNYWLLSVLLMAAAMMPLMATTIHHLSGMVFTAYHAQGLTSDVTFAIGVLAVGVLLVAVTLVILPIYAHIIGRSATGVARAQMRRSLQAIQHTDTRSPVLFLRSFTDDQVRLPARHPSRLAAFEQWLLDSSIRSMTLDHLLLQEATAHGPAVALGNPDDPRPPYGVARGYFEHSDWQGAVRDLCRDAQAIVLVLESSAGLAWEIDLVISSGYADKTLFLVRPDAAETSFGNEQLDNVFARLSDGTSADHEHQAHARHVGPKRGRQAGTFGLMSTPDGKIITAGSSTHSAYAYFILLRYFLRTRAIKHPATTAQTLDAAV